MSKKPPHPVESEICCRDCGAPSGHDPQCACDHCYAGQDWVCDACLRADAVALEALLDISVLETATPRGLPALPRPRETPAETAARWAQPVDYEQLVARHRWDWRDQ